MGSLAVDGAVLPADGADTLEQPPVAAARAIRIDSVSPVRAPRPPDPGAEGVSRRVMAGTAVRRVPQWTPGLICRAAGSAPRRLMAVSHISSAGTPKMSCGSTSV